MTTPVVCVPWRQNWQVGGFVRKLAESLTRFQKLYSLNYYFGTCKTISYCINHGLVVITINFIVLSNFL